MFRAILLLFCCYLPATDTYGQTTSTDPDLTWVVKGDLDKTLQNVSAKVRQNYDWTPASYEKVDKAFGSSIGVNVRNRISDVRIQLVSEFHDSTQTFTYLYSFVQLPIALVFAVLHYFFYRNWQVKHS